MLLQGDGHSRTIVGVTLRPERVLVRDPADGGRPARIHCLSAGALEGRQWQLVCVREGGRALAAGARRGEPVAAAIWRPAARPDGPGWWQYSHWCSLRFDE